MSRGQRARLLVSYTLLLLIDQAFLYAYSVAVFRILGSGLTASMYVSIGYIPRVILLIPGGILSDRIGCGKAFVFSNALRVVCYVIGCVVIGYSQDPLLILLLLSIALGVVDALFLPSSQALPRLIADRLEVAALQGRFSAAQKIAMVTSIVFGTMLSDRLDSVFCIALIAFASLASSLFVPAGLVSYGVPKDSNTRGCPSRAFNVSMRREEALNLVLIFFAELLSASITGYGLISLIGSRGDGEWALGIIQGMASIGGVLGAFLAAWILGRASGNMANVVVRASTSSLLILGLSSACMLALSKIAGLSAANFVFGVATGLLSTMLVTRFVTAVDSGHVGAAMSTMSLVAFGAAPIAVFLSGALEEYVSIGAVFAAVFLGAILMAGLLMREHAFIMAR